jgi:hypothetical protein
MKASRREFLKKSAVLTSLALASPTLLVQGQESAARTVSLFGDHPELESTTTGEWWLIKPPAPGAPPVRKLRPDGGEEPFLDMNVPRDQVVAFALYTQDRGVLKLTAQLFPLLPGEPRVARLELKRGSKWREVATSEVRYPGWDAHFRIENWDNRKDVAYRVRHGATASFEGLIRRDPIAQRQLVVGVLSCNSRLTNGPRAEIVNNLKAQNPDLLFFGGDQSYHHTEHTAGWLEFGLQFRDVIRDRPTITIPDDHDVGHGNLWGENGRKSLDKNGNDGGYIYPAAYVKQVERQQTWHLPDAPDPAPVEQGIGVYFTSLRVGGIDFAILEDRKFKSGPNGKIPKLGPRPDHITDPRYDRKSIDVPGLQLLGARQLRWLDGWTQDWTGAQFKCVLSQTSFCGAVHMHGNKNNRLLADLDCNGWPQSGRNAALHIIRRANAPHLCGDQHLAAIVKQGIIAHRDGPWSFTSPAIVNTIYGRWWHPLDEKAGPNPRANSPLPWTGDYEDGLGNRISVMAYANPPDIKDEKQRGDGYGIARFDKKKRTVTFECWPRFANVNDGDKAQFPGWPMTVSMDDNDGRKATGWLPELKFTGVANPVVQVIEDATGEVLYTTRVAGKRFRPRVFSAGSHTVKIGRDKPDGAELKNVFPVSAKDQKPLVVKMA